MLVKPKTILSLIEKELPTQPYWIGPILPRSSTLLFGGEAKIGKSHLLMELARALSTGTVPFDCNKFSMNAPVKTLFIEQEVGEYGLQKRVKKVFARENKAVYGNNLWYVSKVPEMQLDSKEGREILFDLVEDTKPNVLILDPIGRMNSYDENKADQIQQLFTLLEQLIKTFKEQELSIILSHHMSKPSTDPNSLRDPLDPYNFRGSSKLKDCPDTLVTMQKLKYLATPHKAWEIKVRFETRQDEGLPDFLMTVNADNDLRVKFKKVYEDRPVSISKLGDKGDMPKTQLKFVEA